MLKTLSTKLAKPWKSRIGIDCNNRHENNKRTKLDSRDEISNNKVNSNKIGEDKIIEEKNHQKTSKFKKTVRFSDFFTPKARLAFTKLRQVFVKVSIFYYFDPKYYIWIKMDALGYTIDRILSHLILDNLG